MNTIFTLSNGNMYNARKWFMWHNNKNGKDLFGIIVNFSLEKSLNLSALVSYT